MAIFRQFPLFICVGSTSALITIISRAALNYVAIFELAVAISHVIGVTVAFTLNRVFVFHDFSGSGTGAYARFFAVNIISLAIATTVSSLCFRLIFPMMSFDFHNAYAAHFVGLGATAIPSFLGHKYFSFRHGSPAQGKSLP